MGGCSAGCCSSRWLCGRFGNDQRDAIPVQHIVQYQVVEPLGVAAGVFGIELYPQEADVNDHLV